MKRYGVGIGMSTLALATLFSSRIWTSRWIEDAVGARLCGGYALEGFKRAKYEVETEFRHRLRMAAETLDSSWLEAPEEEPEPVDPARAADAIQKHWQEHATLFVDAHNEAVSKLLLEATARSEFRLLYDREPDEEEMKRAIEWAKTPVEPAPVCSGCDECDEGDCCYSDERPLSPELERAVSSGYSQILAAIKAESKDVKL